MSRRAFMLAVGFVFPPVALGHLLRVVRSVAGFRLCRKPEAAFLKVKVFDPVCGSGSFLVAAHRIAKVGPVCNPGVH